MKKSVFYVVALLFTVLTLPSMADVKTIIGLPSDMRQGLVVGRKYLESSDGKRFDDLIYSNSKLSNDELKELFALSKKGVDLGEEQAHMRESDLTSAKMKANDIDLLVEANREAVRKLEREIIAEPRKEEAFKYGKSKADSVVKATQSQGATIGELEFLITKWSIYQDRATISEEAQFELSVFHAVQNARIVEQNKQLIEQNKQIISLLTQIKNKK